MAPLLIRTAAPAAVAIDRAKVWAHLQTIPEDEDQSPPDLAPVDADYIDTLIEAAVSRLDGPQGLLNRALITQSWQAKYAKFPAEITIPLARCQTVDSVTYLDSDGVEQTLAPSAYRVTGLLTDSCRIKPVNGTAWPSTYCDAEAVVVTFTSGFGAAPGDVPGSIRLAMSEMIATAYAHRETGLAGMSFSVLPHAAARAVTDWIVWNE